MAESNSENEDVPSGADLHRLMYWMDEDGLSVTDLEDLPGNYDRDQLETLLQAGYLKKEGSQYCFDTKAEQYHRGIRHVDDDFGSCSIINVLDNDIIEAKVAEIAERTNERARFIIDLGEIKGAKIQGRIGVYLYCAAGANAVPTDALSKKQFPLHSRTAGRALLSTYHPEWPHLAAQPPETLPSELEHRIELYSSAETEPTPPDFNVMWDELKLNLWERPNVVYNLDKDTSGVHTVALPVRNDRSVPFGALEVSRPSGHFNDQREEEILEILKAAASELSDTVTVYPEV